MRYGKSRRLSVVLGAGFLLLFLASGAPAQDLGWTDVKTRLLPDDSFAVIETAPGGRKIRRCPYRDRNGEIDYDQLIYVLGTLDETHWLDPGNRRVAEELLTPYYDRYVAKLRKKELDRPVDINDASLKELVALPRIGPVIATRIVRRRRAHGRYMTTADIKKVQGIGEGTYRALRFYIRTD